MSDDLVKRLRDRRVCSPAQNSCRNDFICEEAAARIEELEKRADTFAEGWRKERLKMIDAEDKLAKAVELVNTAFNEGFGEGMNDVMRRRGGKSWYESRSRKRIAELKGEKDE